MAKQYYVKTLGGNTEIPITDGTYLTDYTNVGRETGTLIVAFYNSSDEIVTPSAGTVNHNMAAIEGQWHTASSGSSPINAVDCGPAAAYEVPVYNGPAIQGRVVLNGVVGADYCRAYFWRA